MRRFRPLTKLIIKPEIAHKLQNKHGLTKEQAREFFDQFEWEAFSLPPHPKNPNIGLPLYGIQASWKGAKYLMIFGMLHPPGTEAFLVTFYPVTTYPIPKAAIKKRLRDQ